MVQDIQKKIVDLLRATDTILLAHNYQDIHIQEIADQLGDSLELARAAVNIEESRIVFCGVWFMAETAAVLNPDKRVIIPEEMARCPLALFLDEKTMQRWKDDYPGASVAVYVNTTAEIKAMADICITSGNAARVISKIDNDTVLVGPDRNLAWFIQQQVPNKKIIPFPEQGHCYVHRKFTAENVKELKDKYTKAKVVVHPECDPEVQKLADYVVSTSGMLKVAQKDDSTEFIIGTELGMIERLRKEFPNKKFIPLREDAICKAQKRINLENLYTAIKEDKFIVEVPEEIAIRAKNSIQRMFDLS